MHGRDATTQAGTGLPRAFNHWGPPHWYPPLRHPLSTQDLPKLESTVGGYAAIEQM
jgi:hypothetical protein